jgi:alginate O-acetyltransferase complex protein AlgI
MGYRLMLNFNRPYFAKSIAEFWKRWHISLTSWFRDYLYISLGGNRVVRWRWFTNIFIVFLLSGLWHGANWTFILWGALHGSYYLISIWTANLRLKFNKMLGLLHFPRIHQYLKVFITFHLVLFSWIFFRANSLQDAFLIVGNLFSSFDLNSLFTVTGFSQQHFVLAVISILVLIAVELFQRQHKIADWLRARPVLVRWLVYYSGVMIILLFGAYDNSRAFIYFQF